MANFTQANRLVAVTTPLGTDVLLLADFSAQEGLSQLFRFQLDLLAPNDKLSKVDFGKLMGQGIGVQIALLDGQKRHFHGICVRVSQGEKDEHLTAYRMEVVPQIWLLTRNSQSRIFQHESVPDILKKVLNGFVVEYKLQGTFQPRNYCVQYRESDWNFACRLMEEEGIYYFFKQEEGKHTLVLANTPQGHPSLEPNQVRFEDVVGGVRTEDRVLDWQKQQELRSGKYTLWDHCFELPHQHLEASADIQQTLEAGTKSHKLKVGGNDKLEVYEYPGRYAQRFDGVDKGGGDRASDLQKIFEDNKRTVEIRMQEEAAGSLEIQGLGNCRQFISGHKFSLIDHPDANGTYVLTSVTHSAKQAGYRSGESDGGVYENRFTCIPVGLPFRPARTTPKPVVPGTQTAVVVGPAGQEIFTDKYGRVKVQFHWDREGQNDSNSSCWVRVGTPWAGKNWGMIHIPRVGQEVIVAFLEGDPDRPIIVGSVYNADMMPPYELPANQTQSGIKSRSSQQGTPENFNELRFEDKKGEEQVYFHAEKDFEQVVENNFTQKIGFDKKDAGDQTIEIYNHRTTTLEKGNDKTQIKTGNRDVILDKGNDTHQVKMGNRDVQIDMGNDTLTIKMGNQTTKLNLGKSETEALQSIELKVGQSSIKVDQMGVTIKGMMVKVEGQIQTDVKGLMTQVTGTAMLKVGGGIMMLG